MVRKKKKDGGIDERRYYVKIKEDVSEIEKNFNEHNEVYIHITKRGLMWFLAACVLLVLNYANFQVISSSWDSLGLTGLFNEPELVVELSDMIIVYPVIVQVVLLISLYVCGFLMFNKFNEIEDIYSVLRLFLIIFVLSTLFPLIFTLMGYYGISIRIIIATTFYYFIVLFYIKLLFD